MEKLIEQIEILKTKKKEIANKKMSVDTFNLLKSLTLEILKKQLNNTCSTCCYEAYHEIINFDLNKLKSMKECNYILKKGVLLTEFGKPQFNCNANTLTNELAEYHLKRDPFLHIRFDKIPNEFKVKLIEICQNVKANVINIEEAKKEAEKIDLVEKIEVPNEIPNTEIKTKTPSYNEVKKDLLANGYTITQIKGKSKEDLLIEFEKLNK